MISKNMIFRNTLFGVAVCLAGVLTACAEKELSELAPVTDGSGVEICFAPTVGADISTKGSDIQPLGETGLYLRTIISENKTNPFDEIATRATMVNGFDPDGAEGTYSTFRVYSFLHNGLWAENCDSATPYVNGKDAVSLGNGYWGFEESVFWPAWDTNMTFLAFAPVDGGVDISFTEDDGAGNSVYAAPTLTYTDPAVADDETHHGEITAENLAKQADLLVAQTTDLEKGTTKIPMNFSHVFSSVEFICGDMSKGKISKLSLANIAYKGVYDFGTNTWEVGDDRTEYVFPLEVEVPGLEENEEQGENMPSYGTSILSGETALMMIPQDLTGCVLLIEYTPDGENEKMRELAVELNGSWEAGAHITYHISFLAGEDDIIPYLTGQDGYFATYVLAHYDADGNGHVSQAEADLVTELKIGYYPDEEQEPNQTIDFTGIEHFTKLEKFTSNFANELDVTQNAELTYICLKADGTYTSGNIEMPAVPTISTLNLSYNENMKEIADYAFYNNTSLADVTLPSSITTIGDYAFYGLSRDAEPRFVALELPTAVETIGDYAFYDCPHLATINLGNVSSIGEHAFQNCSALAAADLSSVTSKIGEYTFYGCTNAAVDMSKSKVTEIGSHAFAAYSGGAKSISLPSTLETIGDYAFGATGNEAMTTTFTIPTDGFPALKTIGNYAFYYCTAMTTMPLPSTLETIGDFAFGNYDVDIPTKFTVPEAGFPVLESIGSYAFDHCVGLTEFPVSVVDITKAGTGELEMPTEATGALTTIGVYAFNDCTALTSVALPSTITTLSNYAFHGCSALDAFVCESENPPSTGWNDDPNRDYTLDFGADHKPVLYVYKSYKSNYTAESSGYWTTGTSGKFREIINIDAADDPVDESENNYEKFQNGTLKIGTKTVNTDSYGSYTIEQVTESTSYTYGRSPSPNGIYFIDSEDSNGGAITVSFNPNSFPTDKKFIFIGNDFEKRSKVVFNSSIVCEPDVTYGGTYNVDVMFYNVDIEFGNNFSGPILTFYNAKSTKGPVDYLAFDNCHITAKNSPIVAYVGGFSSTPSDTYFDEIYIGDCVWSLPASESTTQLFNFDDSIEGSPTTVTVKNNLFYCNADGGLVPDFRFMTANGLTFGTLDYESNTLVNLGGSSTAGAFEYSSISSATVTKNLTYVAEPSSDYVFFHSASLPTTASVTDNIAYLGDGTYTWYWLYDGASASNPSGVENACTVLTSSPFEGGTFSVSDEAFTPNSTYSDYGYQTN